MTEKMTQDQRLDYLVEEFKKDSVQYKDLETPKDTEGKRYVLRSPMNIRMPKPFPEEALAKVKQGKSKGKTIIAIGQWAPPALVAADQRPQSAVGRPLVTTVD